VTLIRLLPLVSLLLVALGGLGAAAAQPAGQSAARQAVAREPRPATPQPRPHGSRVAVDRARLGVDDGDTVTIDWTKDDKETVRLLGIDTPETRHPEHDLPYGQPFGEEARAFARGVFAAATRVELLRAATLDPFGRTLGYVFVNGRNYSVLAIQARLAAETIGQYGDNGLPAQAAEVAAAARTQGPLAFEPPHLFRARMRELTTWLKSQGLYPPP
jgi:endonuclease YncB( thermonuclease family)